MGVRFPPSLFGPADGGSIPPGLMNEVNENSTESGLMNELRIALILIYEIYIKFLILLSFMFLWKRPI